MLMRLTAAEVLADLGSTVPVKIDDARWIAVLASQRGSLHLPADQK